MLTQVLADGWTRSIGLGSHNIIWNLQACENRVYAATNLDEIYYSDNRGKTWSAFNYKKYKFSFFLASGRKKFMVQGNTVFCSACKDTSWTPILEVPSLQRISIIRDSIYLLKNDTFFVANTDGAGLRPVSPKLPFPIIKFAVAGQRIFVVNEKWSDTSGTKHEENLHRFGPGDKDWVQLTQKTWPDNVTAMTAAGDRIFTGSMHGLCVWSEADSALLPLSDSQWVDDLFSGFGKLFVAPWKPITLNYAAIAAAGIPAGLIQADMLDKQTFLTAAGDSTLYILNQTVNDLHVAYSFHYDGSSFGDKKSLYTSDVMGPSTTVDRLLFDGKTLWAYANTQGLFKSDDIGKSWGFVCNPGLSGLRVFTKLGNRLCTVNESGIYMVSDAGLNWTKVDFGTEPNRMFLDAHISGSDAFVTSTNGFFKTTDAGATWTTIDQKADIMRSSAVLDDNIMFFSHDSGIRGILYSADGGATWNKAYQADSTAERLNNISASNAGALVHSSTRGILYSSDGGATWKPRNTGIADSLYINSLLCYENTLFASTRRDSSWGGGWSDVRGDVFAWSDSLNSWVKKSIGKESLSTVGLCSMGPYIYAYAWASGQYNEMFLSPDSGKHWESLKAISYSDNHRQLSYAYTNNEFLVGSNEGLWRHTIAKPINFYSSVPPRPIASRPGSAISYSLSGRALRFRISPRFDAAPRLTLFSVTGRKLADIQPAFFDRGAGTAAFNLANLASGTFVYKLVLKGAAKNGMIIIPSF